MRDLDHALTLVEATVAAVTLPVTLKMRLGWDRGSINAPDLARRAEAAGVQMITVHGRTRDQFYEGHADWAAIRAVKDVISVPLVANGDVASFCRCRRNLAQSGADGVMIGRGHVAGRGCRRRCRAISRAARAGPGRRAMSWSPSFSGIMRSR